MSLPGISQGGLTKGKACLTSLIPVSNKLTHLVGEWKVGNVVYLDFHEAFDTVLHIIFLYRKIMLLVQLWDEQGHSVPQELAEEQGSRGCRNGATSHCWWLAITSSDSQFCSMCLSTIWIQDWMHSCKFADDTKLEGAVDFLEGQEDLQGI